MQPIERYGVIALLFLMITIGAVVIWGPESDVGATAGHAPAVIAPRTRSPIARERSAAQQRQRKPPLSKHAELPLLANRPEPAQRSGAQAQAGAGTQGSRWLDATGAGAATRKPAGTGGVPATKAARENRPPLTASSLGGAAAAGSASRSTAPASTPGLAGASRKASSGSARVYEIQPGDTLSEIAQAELGRGSRWREIADLNPRVVPERLKAGDKLLLPARGAEPAAAPVAVAVDVPDGATTYSVQPGDTLGQIAQNNLGTWTRWKEIAELNPGVDPDRLQEGQRLVLPTGTVVAARIETEEWRPTGRGGVR